MLIRPLALSALILVALVGCGVPDNSAVVAMQEKKDSEALKPATAVKATEPKSADTKPAETKPGDAKPGSKPPVEDLAKMGLIVTDTTVGTGKAADLGDSLYMLYRGTLKQGGKEFDSTAKRNNEPFVFPLGAGQVIKGWDLGIRGMKEGGKRRLEIPAALAYGAEAKGDDIPANSDLVFDIELLYVLKADETNVVERKTVKDGSGPAAKKGDVVTIKYVGKLLNGTQFDDNGGKTLQFKIGDGQVIQGLELAVQGMKKGEVVDATVPPNLGIPPSGPNSKVPVNSILKFEITMVSVG